MAKCKALTGSTVKGLITCLRNRAPSLTAIGLNVSDRQHVTFGEPDKIPRTNVLPPAAAVGFHRNRRRRWTARVRSYHVQVFADVYQGKCISYISDRCAISLSRDYSCAAHALGARVEIWP